MDIINIPPNVLKYGYLTGTEVNAAEDVILIGQKLSQLRNGTQWLERIMTMNELAVLMAAIIPQPPAVSPDIFQANMRILPIPDTIASGSLFIFPNNDLVVGNNLSRQSNSTIKVNVTGYYRISFSINTSDALNNAVITVNGTSLPIGNAGKAVKDVPITISIVASLIAGDMVAVKNTGAATATLVDKVNGISVSTFLRIEKINS